MEGVLSYFEEANSTRTGYPYRTPGFTATRRGTCQLS